MKRETKHKNPGNVRMIFCSFLAALILGIAISSAHADTAPFILAQEQTSQENRGFFGRIFNRPDHSNENERRLFIPPPRTSPGAQAPLDMSRTTRQPDRSRGLTADQQAALISQQAAEYAEAHYERHVRPRVEALMAQSAEMRRQDELAFEREQQAAVAGGSPSGASDSPPAQTQIFRGYGRSSQQSSGSGTTPRRIFNIPD